MADGAQLAQAIFIFLQSVSGVHSFSDFPLTHVGALQLVILCAVAPFLLKSESVLESAPDHFSNHLSQLESVLEPEVD